MIQVMRFAGGGYQDAIYPVIEHGLGINNFPLIGFIGLGDDYAVSGAISYIFNSGDDRGEKEMNQFRDYDSNRIALPVSQA